MAKGKKKTTAKRTHHHKKHHGFRFGGVGNFNVTDALLLGGGLVVGNMAGIMIQKHFTRIPQKVLALGELVVGVMHTNQPNPIIRGAAYGFAGAGASGFAHETGILRGVDEVVSGMFNSTTLAGYSEEFDMPVMNGMPNGTTLGQSSEQAQAPVMEPQVRYEPVYGDIIPAMGM